MLNELSIVVPCISTTESVPRFIDQLAQYLMESPSEVECVVVMNEHARSPHDLVRYVRTRYPWLKFILLQREGSTRGFGALARFGIAYATSRYIVLVSPYGEDDVSIIAEMLKRIRVGAQVVQATRYATREAAHHVPLHYRIYQLIYRFLTRALLGAAITDSTYGFKMFDRPFVQALGLTQNGYSLSPEITFKALLAGGKVEYIPSSSTTSPLNKDFKLYREGVGYARLLLRGFFHRIGVLWF